MKCETENVEKESDGNDPPRFRIVATVNSTDPDVLKLNEPVTAYYGPDDSYNLRPKQAKEAFVRLTNSSNSSCWVLQQGESVRISLKFIPPYFTSYLVWLTTIIAVCTGLYLFFSMISHLSDTFYLGNPSSNAIRNIRNLTQAPGNVAAASNRPRCLSIRQTRFTCNVFGREWVPSQEDVDEASDWVCSICLDEPDPNSPRPVRTVLLPCTHRFHRSCIRYWLRKGKPACPLCQWDARQLFDEDGQPKQVAVDIPAAADSAPLQCVAVVRDGPPESVLTLNATDHERFTENVANWEFLNDEESMSSAQTPQPSSGRQY